MIKYHQIHIQYSAIHVMKVLLINGVYFLILVSEISGVSYRDKSHVHSDDEESTRYTDLPSQRKVHGCQLSNNQYPFNVLPGLGWDNLANQELGQVLKIKYNECRSSNDGSFLIPDNSILTPKKKSVVQMNSDIIDHYSNYTSLTSKSINVDANYVTPYYQISGSFSWEKTDIKARQIKEKSSISRVQLRYELYTLTIQPDNELDSTFRDRIRDIGAILKDGRDSIYPKYLADLLIRDFGTHVIKSVDAGAILSKIDILKSNYIKKYASDTTNISAAASYSMTKAMGINIRGNYNKDNRNLNEYNENCAITRIDTFGGRPFGSNFTLQDWERSFEADLVTIDRRGDPLNYVITPRAVPEFDEKTVYDIEKLIKDAISRYYSANTRIGCMNMKSKNFNDDANVDSGNCQEPEMLFNLGGVFQTCVGDSNQCSEMVQFNPSTGGFSCPPFFDPVKLQEGLNKCSQVCTAARWTKDKCVSVCSNYILYWCAPTDKAPLAAGYLFGGIYTKTYPNPVTNAYTCPPTFIAVKFGVTAKLCISIDKENGAKHSLPFGGFYSCNIGNPLAENLTRRAGINEKYWSNSCGTGYSAHLAVVDRGCQITYCVKSNSLSGKEQPPLHRPPFIDLEFGPNVTVVSNFESPMGFQLSLSKNGRWEDIVKITSTKYGIIIITVVAAVLTSSLIVAVIFAIQKRNLKQKVRILPGYDNLDGETATNIANRSVGFSKCKSHRVIIDK